MTGRDLIVLADDAGHRAVPLWLRVSKQLWRLMDRPGDDAVTTGVLQETAARLLGHTAGVRVTAVDIELASEDVPELRPEHGRGAGRAGHGRRNPACPGERRVRPGAGRRGRGTGPGGRCGVLPEGVVGVDEEGLHKSYELRAASHEQFRVPKVAALTKQDRLPNEAVSVRDCSWLGARGSWLATPNPRALRGR